MRVFIVGRDAVVEQMYLRRKFEITDRPTEADIIQFIGGADINPELYGEHRLSCTAMNPPDDVRDLTVWRSATPKQMKIGICRGGQFLNVMNAGAMWQHVGGHGVHQGHEIEDVLFKRKMVATSTHHQMMIPAKDGAEVLAFARNLSTNHKTAHPNGRDHDGIDPEVIFYERTNTLCFQPHPEYYNATTELQDYFFDCIEFLKP